MKKRIYLFIAASLLFLSSCIKERISGEGPVVTETRPLSNFTGVSSGFSGTVNFKIDPVYKVEITGQQNILDVLRTNIVNGVLDIDFKNNVRIRGHENVIVNISAPTADYFRLSGSGNIYAQGALVTNRLGLEVSGSGSISVQQATVADKINAKISGSGNIAVAAGIAKNEELRISGSGDMNLSSVIGENATTHISGSGDMKVNLSQSLDAHISGSGSVYYRGTPVISVHISGSGKVKPF